MYRLGSMKFVLDPMNMYVCDEWVEKRYTELVKMWRDREAVELIRRSCEPMTKYVLGQKGMLFIVDVPKNKVVVKFKEGKVYGFYPV